MNVRIVCSERVPSPEHWSGSYFRETTNCEVLLNNHNEVFNKIFVSARSKSILGLLQGVRVYLMLTREIWISRQKGNICRRIMKRLEKLKKGSALCYLHIGEGESLK